MSHRSTPYWVIGIALAVLAGALIAPTIALAPGPPPTASPATSHVAASVAPAPAGLVRAGPFAPAPVGGGTAGGGSTSGGSSSGSCTVGTVVDAYCGHYYQGAAIIDPAPIASCNLLCETPPLATSVSMTVTMPTAAPAAGDTWAFILSAFDNAGLPSYDQVGFAPYAGYGWVPVYSYSTACGEPSGITSFYAVFATLAPNTQYTFTMNAYRNGTIGYFADLTSTGAPVFSMFHNTGGDAFYLVPYVTCWNDLGTYSAYTVMEEIFSVEYSTYPNYDIAATGVTTPGPLLGFPYGWGSFSIGAPGGYVGTPINGNSITFLNTHFEGTLVTAAGKGLGTLYITEGTGGAQTTGTVTIAGSLSCGSTACDEVSFPGLPSGWCFDGCGAPTLTGFPFSSGLFYVTISAPSYAPTGVYNLEMEVSSLQGAGGPTFVSFEVVVAPDVGGCVAAGTLIATPGGAVPVQSLAPGDPVLEYNLSAGLLETGYVLFTTQTNESSVVSVNHGLIELTPTDQPIYIRNATFTGWLASPDQLAVGDELFAPQSGAWVPVTSVSVIVASTSVYAVVTSNENNFLGSGVLLDLKFLFAMHVSPIPTAPISPGGVEFAQSAVDPANGLLYVAEPENGIVGVIDPITQRLVATVPIDGVPMGLAYDPAAQSIVVSDFLGAAIYEIQPSTNQIVAGPIAVGEAPTSITFDPLSQTLWVTNAQSDTVSLLYAGNLSAAGSQPAGTYPVASVFDPAQRAMWVASEWSGALLGFSATASASPIGAIPLPGLPDSLSVLPWGGRLMVAEIGASGVLSVAPLAAEDSDGAAATATLPSDATGLAPTSVLVDPMNGWLYIANGTGGDVLVVQPGSGAIIADVAVTGSPTGLAFDWQNGSVYAIDSVTGAISAVPVHLGCGGDTGY